MVRETRPRLIFSGKMYRFRPAANLMDARFLEAFLQTSFAWSAIDAMKTGGSDSGLNLTHDRFRQLLVPLAPLNEQLRIAARIDALFAEVAEGEAALATARKGLETFRRALLKAAVSGELTKDWRAENPPTETGRGLLARVAKARAAKAPVKGRGRRDAEGRDLNVEGLLKLPEEWAWATLGETVSEMEYGTSEKCERDFDGIPVLRIANVNFGSLDFSNLKFAPANAPAPLLKDGDLIFNRTNSAELVGKTAVYRSQLSPCSIASYLIRVRFEEIEPEFVSAWINSIFGRIWIASHKSQQVGQANLSGGTLKGMPIPIPPPAEAAEILRRVSDALAAVADAQALLDAEAADAARLKQSILKAAFEGRLSVQDPADEPASALLARVKLAAAPARRRGVSAWAKAGDSRAR